MNDNEEADIAPWRKIGDVLPGAIRALGLGETGVANRATASAVIPKTPSDWRGRRNSIALMRRMARGGRP